MKILLALLLTLILALLLTLLLPSFAHNDWSTDYKAAVAQAKAQNKLLLLHFTGSDWCPSCQLLDKEVISQKSFQEFADKNYVGVLLDFPQETAVKQQNTDLYNQYNVNGFPTLIVTTPDGKELGRVEGYYPGLGPNAVISKLESIK